jgi:hypothetical protein
MEVSVIIVALGGLAAIVGIRLYEKRHAPTRIKAPVPKPIEKPPETEHERLIRVLTTLDYNAALRMDSLKWFLFWLPFIWGAISGIIWIVVIETR